MKRRWLAVNLVLCQAALADSVNFLVVNQHGEPLQHAVVSLRVEGLNDTQTPDEEIAVEQANQQFSPRVLAVARGSAVRFPNTDMTQHHVYSFSSAKQFELELYSGDSLEPIEFDQSGIVALGCNIHDWMLGYVYVTDDEVFGVTDADGKLTLSIRGGDIQQVTWWHPAAKQKTPQTRTPASATDIDLQIDVADTDPLAFELDPLQDLFSHSH